MDIRGVNIRGGNFFDLTDLYPFSTFLFTNANAQGRTGPTLAGLQGSYSNVGNTWINNTAYFNVVTQGIQLWKVPHTGTYQITAAGAGGGYNTKANIMGGNGAIVTNQVTLTQGQTLAIVVGQRGSNMNSATTYSGAAGGGGSFVYDNDSITYYTVAGGGGGAASLATALVTTQANAHANAFTTSGGTITAGAFRANGGVGGLGGNVEQTSKLITGGAGAGILTSGQDGQTYTGTQQWGGTRANNWVGGNTYTTFGAPGGFGGGGVAGDTDSTYYVNSTYIWAGGGGGYSGGAAGFNTRAGDGQYAGGGGSYYTGTFISGTTGGNFGNGYVQITKIN